MKNKILEGILNLFQDLQIKNPKQYIFVGCTFWKNQKAVISTDGRNLFAYIRQRFLSRGLLRNDNCEIMQQSLHKVPNTSQLHFKLASVRYKYLFLILVAYLLIPSNGFSQSNRSTLNDGVDKYEQKKYSDAEVDFRKVVENSPKNFEANFNLGTSYYKQEKYEDAIKSFTGSLKDAKDDKSRAKVYHNIGNSLLKSDKIEESIEAYKNALKFNPNDEDTKYNLSYALEMLKNKDKNEQNKNDKNDQKKDDQKKDQDNQNQDQQNKDQDNQDQKENQQPKDQEAKQDNTKQPQQPKEQKISKEEAQRILEALKNNEKDLQKLLRKKTGKVKKTDKDW